MYKANAGVVAVATIVVVLLLGVGAWMMQGGSAVTPAEPPGIEATVEAGIRRPEYRPASTATVPALGAVAPSLTSTLAADQIEQARQSTAKFEALWNADLPAPASVQTEQTILAAMSSDVVAESRFQPATFDANCRASMCRIQTRFAAGTDGGEWATRLLLELGSSNTFGASSIVTQPAGKGASRVVVYAFRPGHTPGGS